jgi:flagellar protein FlbD
MIHLTRLNNSTLTVNSDLIKFVEKSPDTVITLLNGEKVLVRETVEQVLERIVEFRRRLLAGTVAWRLESASMLPLHNVHNDEREE